MMLRYEQSELEELQSVDPRVIQPIVNYTVIDSVYNQPEAEVESGALSLADCKNVSQDLDRYQIEMEQCINLNLLLSRMPEGCGVENTADELNTPIFDIPTKQLNVINIQDTTDTDVDRQKQNPFDFTSPAEEEGIQEIIVIGGEDYSDNIKAEIKTNSEDHSVVNNNSDITDNTMLSYDMSDVDINLDEYDLLSDCNEAMLLDVFGVEMQQKNTEEVNVVDDSEVKDEEELSVLSVDLQRRNDQEEIELEEPVCNLQNMGPLKLNLGKYLGPTVDMQTPDVINTIFSIEKDFNPFIYGEMVKVEEVLPLDENSSSIAYSEAPSCSTIITNKDDQDDLSLEYTPPPPKNSRKRKNLSDYEIDDDDEDYVPPGKRQKPKVKQAERIAKRRGRPSLASPQSVQRLSVSSDNSESSKYREMRDKNNEASRKSRQKRRTQEQNYEKEKEELALRNTQLKAQVSELERSVSTLREDLMKLMLRK